MASERPIRTPEDWMADMAQALADMRDAWVNMSLMLGDMQAEQQSPERDEVCMEVERYLARLREGQR